MPVFLFTDIEGSTRLSEEQTEAVPGPLRRHHAVLFEQVEAAAAISGVDADE